MKRLPTARCRGGTRDRGFSLLEALVAFVISGVALLLASGLLLEAESRMAHAARRALDPVGQIAAKQIRADLRAAATVRIPLTSGWSRGPLELREHPAGRVTYEKKDTELIREVVPGGRRVVLQGISTFRWRLRGRAVEIDLRHRVTPRLGRLAAGGVREAPILKEEKLLFRVTPRGGGGRQW